MRGSERWNSRTTGSESGRTVEREGVRNAKCRMRGNERGRTVELGVVREGERQKDGE